MTNLTIQYILVGLFFALIAVWIIVKSIRRRRRKGGRDQGCGGCSCGCCGRSPAKPRQMDRDCCASKRRHS